MWQLQHQRRLLKRTLLHTHCFAMFLVCPSASLGDVLEISQRPSTKERVKLRRRATTVRTVILSFVITITVKWVFTALVFGVHSLVPTHSPSPFSRQLEAPACWYISLPCRKLCLCTTSRAHEHPHPIATSHNITHSIFMATKGESGGPATTTVRFLVKREDLSSPLYGE